MVYSPAFIFSSVYSLGFFPCAGLRLLALRQFQAFLASSARSAFASSFCFCSAVRLCSILGLAVVANRSVKPTRLRRAAYFRSLAPQKNRFIQAHDFSNGIQLLKRCAALGLSHQQKISYHKNQMDTSFQSYPKCAPHQPSVLMTCGISLPSTCVLSCATAARCG